MTKMFKREDFNIVTESPHQTEPSPSSFSRKNETSAASGGKLLKVVAVSFGLLCVLQVSLNVSLRLGYFTRSISESEAQVALLCESNNNVTKERDDLEKTYNNLLIRTRQLESSHENLMREKEQMYKSLLKAQGWVHNGSSLYYISSVKKSWQKSRDDCWDRGADLMIIDNRAEQDFVETYQKRMWIGLSDAKTEGVWKWVDGSLLQDSSSWCPNEPNNGSGKEDCGEYIPSKDCWNDHNCFHLNFWICEKKKA
ncbi:CD209 antigen-like protein D [Gouania willdenowi]|uniref:CD209 antigen-like protein D n=1 Tax=Gouania willdenowi TaxID=441366 RepID=UPI001054878B|nr:CD209 antigen-like protein D [Gouania willdenowi]